MRKLLISILAVGISAAFIYGATMAWFTAEATIDDVTFTAGTLIIDASINENTEIEACEFENINPGDVKILNYEIVNKGSKSAWIRVDIGDLTWQSADNAPSDEALPTDNVTLTFSEGWLLEGDYLYYATSDQSVRTDTIIPGTYTDSDDQDVSDRTVPLAICVEFDGPLTTNRYQGAKLTLAASTIQAIQTTNGATWGDYSYPNY